MSRLDEIKARAAEARRTGINVYSHADVLWLIEQVDDLKDWQAGATGAATIMHPVRTGPHTEAAYCAHKASYEGGPEAYRVGADVVGAGHMAAKQAWMGAIPAHDPLTCPCCQSLAEE
jgi:hypothetical protein